jgi:hypothetical protein
MATWEQFSADSALAERGRERLGIGIAYLATVRRDGSPRLHPVSPIFADGSLFLAISGDSPKRWDLANDGRYALHALPPDPSDAGYDEFEFNITGRARRIPNADEATWAAVREGAGHVIHDEDWLFELDVAVATTTAWTGLGVPGQPPTPARDIWREGQ